MTGADAGLSAPLGVTLDAPDDFEAWADEARRLVRAGIAPDYVLWSEGAGAAGDLFARAAGEKPAPFPSAPAAAPVRASRAFVAMARKAVLHADPGRFALLYRLLWRQQAAPGLMQDGADPDVRRLAVLDRTVRRDIHKMRAFLRFRRMDRPEGGAHYVAWFEPEHHILRANAAFFVNRFATMRWSILTPRGALHWDGARLTEGPPARRTDCPDGDDMETLWRTYYAAIFNPARLKLGAMLKEMPRKYWSNMPETALIPELVAQARARESLMIAEGSSGTERPRLDTLEAIGPAIQACRSCPIGCNGTRAVMGEGPGDARLMVVGEQPGDSEERMGRPFVGPAGRLLDTHLEAAGLDRGRLYLTNAVKHFKFEPRGKRRLHKTPSAREIDICRWWVDNERAIVRPELLLALGASAARGLLGRTVGIQKVRGQPQILPTGEEVWIAPHPSYLLRLQGEARDREEARFAEDLSAVAKRLALTRHPGESRDPGTRCLTARFVV